ncbi:MAG: HEAT repeat domain-containing protein [bacterium]
MKYEEMVLAEIKQMSTKQKLKVLKSLKEEEDFTTDKGIIFFGLVDDEEPKVREEAIRGLWDYPEPQYIQTLIDLFQMIIMKVSGLRR